MVRHRRPDDLAFGGQLLSARVSRLEHCRILADGRRDSHHAVRECFNSRVRPFGSGSAVRDFVPRITLFLFGGVSQIATEPPSPGAEFWIAITGPLVSFALAASFWALEPFVVSVTPLFALAKYLAFLNWILAIFNLIPGFPLDGGRVFRAFVWGMTGKLRRATNIAAFTGRFFGFLLIFLGVWQALRGNFFNGLWIAFIGWYLESAAASQLQQEAVKSLIGDHKVLDAMRRDVPGISRATPHYKSSSKSSSRPVLADSFIVSGPSGLAGIITLAAIRAVPRAAWPTTTVSQAMIPFHKLATTGPGASLWSALEEMGREGVNQLPVVEGNGIVGMLSREDILHYLGVLRALAA